jgi:four helix bundle protein
MSTGRGPRVIRSHRDTEIYELAFDSAMQIFELSRSFPKEERYSLTDQLRRSCRSVVTNFAEAWRKRRYQAAFVSKLSDAEMEAAETQAWLEFAVKCRYLQRPEAARPYHAYNRILAMLVGTINKAEDWVIQKPPKP